jgi:uncharacterized protein YcbK (DUF882 family)
MPCIARERSRRAEGRAVRSRVQSAGCRLEERRAVLSRVPRAGCRRDEWRAVLSRGMQCNESAKLTSREPSTFLRLELIRVPLPARDRIRRAERQAVLSQEPSAIPGLRARSRRAESWLAVVSRARSAAHNERARSRQTSREASTVLVKRRVPFPA